MILKYTILVLCITYINAYDEIDVSMDSGVMLKILRAMVNQTKSDTLNLPANASSIRENITDTFSCENRTYGYYADVDNDCQIFHVCLPSQTQGGRNVTYRWSFICPNETIFNQEVLVCTRPIDAIDCQDSPMYYDVNMEIGKTANDTEQAQAPEPSKNVPQKTQERERIKNNNKRKPANRKPILLAEYKSEEIVEEKDDIDEKDNEKQETVNKVIKTDVKDVENIEFGAKEPEVQMPVAEDSEPLVQDVNNEFAMNEDVSDDEVNSRMASERSLKNDRRRRGMFRFKADAQD